MTAPQQNQPVLQIRAAIPRRYSGQNRESEPLRAVPLGGTLASPVARVGGG